MCTDWLKIYCVPATRPHARLLTMFVGDGGTWCYIGFRLEIPAVYFCRVFIIFEAEICIYAPSRILIAGVSPCRVVTHRPGGVLWRALTKACGAIGEYYFDTLAGDDVANNTLTRSSARGELLNCFGALSSVILHPHLCTKWLHNHYRVEGPQRGAKSKWMYKSFHLAGPSLSKMTT